MTVSYAIRLRRDSSTRWAKVNPILANGEPGYERDTRRLKIGTGSTPWNNLPYFNSGDSIPGPEGPIGESAIFPMPMGVFDFSDRGSVMAQEDPKCYGQPYGEDGFSYHALIAQKNSEWPTQYQHNALGGRSALVISAEDAEALFIGDAVNSVESPMSFLVARLDEVLSQRALLGSNAGDYAHLITWDDSGTVRWGCEFYYEDAYTFRTTEALVDTSLHVYGFPHALDMPGIYIDGVLWPWTDATPSGWLTRRDAYVNFDTFIGAGGSTDRIIVDTIPPGRFGELRIYESVSDSFIAELSSLLKLKWQGNVVPSVEALSMGMGGHPVDPGTPATNDILYWDGAWKSRAQRIDSGVTVDTVLGPNEEYTLTFATPHSKLYAITYRVEILEGSLSPILNAFRTPHTPEGDFEGSIDLSLDQASGRDELGGTDISTWYGTRYIYADDQIAATITAGPEGGSFHIRFMFTD